MFCPLCKCEFRPGFTRCEGCNADLVEDLAAVEASPSDRAEPPPISAVSMAEYCGFLDLDEARQARDRVRRERIASDILIREAPDSREDGPVKEEYWLRVDAERHRLVSPILGFDAVDATADDPETVNCPQCGQAIVADESFCPGCGARFERS